MKKCIKCNKEFKTKDALNAHQRVHSDKPRSGRDIELIKQKNIQKGIDSYNKYLNNPTLCIFCKKPLLIHNMPININDYKGSRKLLLQKLRINKFCNSSCAASYHNAHKTTGFRRSKLEIYLEKELPKLFPNLLIIYNDRKEVGYELDIYIPSLKLAFELNGIFHYEPIYGKEKLETMQFNDKQKFALCQQKLISLCVIDTTSLKYFKGEKAKKFLDIITNIINEKIQSSGPS